MRVSSGCIRLRPDDIEALFRSVPGGTRVQIVNQPLKVSVEPDGKRYVEVHQPLSRSERDDPQVLPIVLNGRLSTFAASPLTERAAFDGAMARRSGMPVLVSHAAPLSNEASTNVLASASAPAPIDAAIPEAVLDGR